jgi:histidine ammonia-lyase
LLAPLESSRALMHAHRAVRKLVPTLVDDRPPAPDIHAITELISNGTFEYAAGIVVN